MPGAKNLAENATLKTLLNTQATSDKLYGAVCASPVVVLQEHGLLKNKKATAFPAMCDKLENKEAVLTCSD